MSKRKILTLAMALCMVAILAIGGTLAYFTDTDTKTNTFTVGNVTIDLTENFTDGQVLRPATGSAQAGTLQNGITKEVYVTNTGSEQAYVRVHIAIPSILDNGDPSFDAGKNVLHFNYGEDTVGDGKWDWSKAADDDVYTGNWNYYTTEIDSIDYNVYVVTYTAKMIKGAKTPSAMTQVYLDSKVTNEDINKINATLGTTWKIYVAAEGAQVEGFANAYDALDTAFGKPGTYTVNFLAAGKGQ